MYPLNKIKDGTAVKAEAPLSFKEGIAKFNPNLFEKYEKEKRLSQLDQRKTTTNMSPLSRLSNKKSNDLSAPPSAFQPFRGKPNEANINGL